MSTDPHNLQIANVSRRRFLKGVGTGAALVLAARWNLGLAEDGQEKQYGAEGMAHGWVDDPTVFISINTDGSVSIVNHRAEMGQGIRTSVVMVIADEMGADWDRVTVHQAIAHEEKYGNQNTDGSRSMRHWFDPLRRCGAAARTMLEQAAAKQWQVDVSECRTDVHEVVHTPSARRLSFAELAEAAAELAVPPRESLQLKKPEQWRYIMREPGSFKNTNHQQPLAIDGQDIVNGQAIYAADTFFDNMLYAVIARPPAYGAKIKSVDDREAKKIPGVEKILTLSTASQPSGYEPLGGVAVLASNTWAAIQGRKALNIEWDNTPAGANGSYNSVAYKKQLQQTANQPGKAVRSQGDIKAALTEADKTVSAEYYAPHMTQAPMEPPAAIARIGKDSAEVWTSVQNPQAARDGVAKRLNLKPEQVTINCTLLGGGFGRKAKPDYVFEAIDLSKQLDGRPVRVQWTREDDIQHSFFHTVALEHMQASLDKNGTVTGWLHRSVSPSIMSLFAPDDGHQSAMEVGQGIRNMPFQIPAIQQETGEAMGHIRIGWFRSVYNIPHAFAIQSFVHELATAAGKDHRDFLLQLLGPARKIDPRTLGATWNYGENPDEYPIDVGRYRQVIERATQEAGWGKEMPPNRGLGLAVHHSFVSYCAMVVDVEVDNKGKVIVHRADIAFDCGPQVNPDRVRSQLEGAFAMGVGIALMTEITAQEGAIAQSNFHDYLIPRLTDVPTEIHTHNVNNSLDVPIGGVGEPGLPPVAPAICNAIFAATGTRIRTLPIKQQLATNAG
ncbi:xanthine dehydrogenase family protein molybdopterin-binding subunit [Gilvimarinus sp. DA14]|uniref:xanthine dehydrogenase family protein molybdopterin-binding subunit n=1 Tax=Gilvimarinus sp. DA14 TaxID=2956798 RepID=UPI0020B87166|nr:molybdopterin cofactor-binding domain-containing protein [Gilvimarinus sp. DA14]UTF60627.1 molybdopterin-dependent oxidoreductase [Gilvimarinus sp. DA14]